MGGYAGFRAMTQIPSVSISAQPKSKWKV